MKVLFSITYYSPYVSGLTIYVKRMAESLAKEGNQASIICFLHDKELRREEQINQVFVRRVKPDIKISKGFLSISWITISLKMVKQADCLVINLPQFEGCITALIARLLGKRVVCVYHCEISLRRGLKNKIIQKVLEGANQLSLLLCHKVVTYTHDYADHSRILKPFINKLKVIYPPVTKPVVDRLVKQRLDRVIGRRDITIGVAARLAEEKGMEYLFNSIPILKEELEGKKIMIAIAGATDPIGEGKYKKEITKLVGKYKDNIVFLGTLSQEEIGAFYSLLDVLVLPSINSTEAFGMVQVEAMLCGVPVVASSLPGVRVPIQKTGMGLIIPIRNSLKIAKAIIKILIERRKYIRPLTIIEKEFDLSDTITKFKKILVNDN